jgi:hypothetical protein
MSPVQPSTSIKMTTKKHTTATMASLLLCLVSLALVSVTNACDGHHHHHQHKAHADHDHHNNHKQQRRLRSANDHHHHHGDNHAHDAADCDEDHFHSTQGATEQGVSPSEDSSRELFSRASFLEIEGVEWRSAQEFQEGGGRCHTRELAADEMIESDNLVKAFRKRGGRRRLRTVVVPLYFHVLIGNNKQGALSNQQIEDQIDVLKAAFAPDFTFELKAVTTTVNERWFRSPVGSQSERDFKASLRQGGGDALNFYTLAPSDGVLGWATLPSSYYGDDTYDGVCVNSGSLPGGTINRYNEGMCH